MAEAKNKTDSPKSKIVAKSKTAKPQLAPEENVELDTTRPLAKAGKRSTKAVKEAEEKQAKEVRKTEAATKPKDVATPHVPTVQSSRSKLERAGKKYRESAKLVEKDTGYTLAQAMELATKTSPTKFDASVEMHINLGVDPRQADQNVRSSLVLPAGTGKVVRIAVLADADEASAATKAGADITGTEPILKNLEKGTIDFDILIATPQTMARLGKYARLLGPRGLMPNPKSGTVTTDVGKAVSEAKAGRVEFRVDSTGIIHLAIGKVSFGKDKLLDNAQAVIAGVKAAKPASVKGMYVKAIHVSTTMGPGIKVALSEAI